MERRTCFFIGHREASDDLRLALGRAIEQHITEYGVTEFIVGQYGGFDRLAAQAVKAAKECHPEITLTLLLPYYPLNRLVKLSPGFDDTFYPPGMEKVPKPYAIVRANRYMVDHSGYLIAYVRHPASNAWDLVEYARARERRGLIHVTLLRYAEP